MFSAEGKERSWKVLSAGLRWTGHRIAPGIVSLGYTLDPQEPLTLSGEFLALWVPSPRVRGR